MSELLVEADLKQDVYLPRRIEMKYADSHIPAAVISSYLGLRHSANQLNNRPIRPERPDIKILVAREYSASKARRKVDKDNNIHLPPIGSKSFRRYDPNAKISHYLGLGHTEGIVTQKERDRSVNYTHVLALVLGLAMLYNQLVNPQVIVDRSDIPQNGTAGFEPGKRVYQFLGYNRELIPKNEFLQNFSPPHPITSSISYTNDQ